MIRRIGEPPHRNQTYKMRAGAYAILPMKGQFLLTAQTDEEIDVQLPGGGIDPGESPLQALHREVWEETGWRIARPRRLGAFRRFVFMPEYDLWAEKLCHIYVAHPAYQISEPIEPDHMTLMMPGEDACDVLGNEGDQMFMDQYLKSRGR